MKGQRNIWPFFLILLLPVLFICDLLTGSAGITLNDVFQVLFGKAEQDSAAYIIVIQSRLPKALTAICAGAALPVAGLMMQTFFRNPVAGPDILGVSAGSSLSVALVMLTGGTIFSMTHFNSMAIIVAAIAGAIGVLLVILIVSARIRDAMTLLIFGIMFGMSISAIVGVLQYYSDKGALKLFMLWTFGSLGGVTWPQLYLLLPIVIVSVLLAFNLSKSLNLLLLGEQYAVSLGIRLQRVRYLVIILTAVLTGAITALCGPIAFIGIAVPHLARMILKRNDHRLLIPFCALMGSIIVLICDMLTQLPGNTGVLPLNAITAFMGAPFVIFIIWKHQHIRRAL